MQWLDLRRFGIELKRIELSNNFAFPAVIITDLELYNQSGGTPLEALNSANDTGFLRLSGRKGRNLNTPVYFLTKPYNADGAGNNYKITPAICKLLNKDKQEIDSCVVTLDDAGKSNAILTQAFGDFERFNNAVVAAQQAYPQTTIYALKQQPTPMPIRNTYEFMSANQHGLFPKTNIDALPYGLLHNLGFGGDIIRVGFLNPKDAFAQGYSLDQLEPILVNTENPILPVSINANLSINFIPNFDLLPHLTYSSFKWEKNINLINDYNSLHSLKENSAAVLNARPSNITSAAEMESHLQNLSMVLQHHYENNHVSKTYKAIKYNNKGVWSFVAKNENNEWRYLEREGFKRTDMPLTFDNYIKAVMVVAHNNLALANALQLRTMQAGEFDNAMQRVRGRHKQIYKNYVFEGALDPNQPPPQNRIFINTKGIKVASKLLKELDREFVRDNGRDLTTEATKSLVAGMRQLSGATSINEVLAGQEVDISAVTAALAAKNIKTIIDRSLAESGDMDAAISILDAYKPSTVDNKTFNPPPAVDVIAPAVDVVAPAVEVVAPAVEVVAPAVEVVSPIQPVVGTQSLPTYKIDDRLTNLPRNIVSEGAYSETNKIFQTLQHIELSSIPWWTAALSVVRTAAAENTEAVLDDYVSRMRNYLENGGDEQAINAISNLNSEQLASLANTSDLTNQIETYITKESIKSNILQYQLTQKLAGAGVGRHGLLVFNTDSVGNYIPFKGLVDYNSAVNVLRNHFATKNNIENKLVAIDSDIRTRLDAFVAQNYSTLKTPMVESSNVIELTRAFAHRSDFEASLPDAGDYTPPLGELKLLEYGNNIGMAAVEAIVNAGQLQTIEQIHASLDNSLSKIASDIAAQDKLIGGTPSITNHPRVQEIINRYNQAPIDDLNTGARIILAPISGVPLSITSKLAVLSHLYSASMNLVAAGGVNPETLDASRANVAKALNSAQSLVRKVESHISPDEYQDTLAAQFLLQHQMGVIPPDVSSFKFKIDSRTDNYTVLPILNGGVTGRESQLRASNYNGAVREVFSAYQLNRVAEDLGIAPLELKLIGQAAVAMKAKDNAEFLSAFTEAVGYSAGMADIEHAELHIADSSNNPVEPHKITLGKNTIEFKTEHEAMLVANKIALMSTLVGVKSTIKASPLIEVISDLSRFDLVSEYLSAPPAEKATILQEQERLPRNFNQRDMHVIANSLSGFAFDAATNVKFKKLGINKGKYIVATSIPQTNRDVITVRLVKPEWIDSSRLHIQNFNYNLTPTTLDFREPNKAIKSIKGAVIEHMDSPESVYVRPSHPKAISAKANGVINVSPDLQPVLDRAAHWNTHKSAKDQQSFAVEAAFCNFENALRAMSPESKRVFNELHERKQNDIKQQVTIAASRQDGTSLPRIAIGLKGEYFDPEFTPVETIDIYPFMRTIKGEAIQISIDDDFTFERSSSPDLVKLHTKVILKAGFDPLAFNDAVTAQMSDNKEHDLFNAAIPSKPSITDVFDAYYNKVVADAGTSDFSGKVVYAQIGSEANLPSIKIVESSDRPNIIDLSNQPEDQLRKYLAYQLIVSNVIPSANFVDNTPVIEIPSESISPQSLIAARTSMIECLKAGASGNTMDESLATYLVDTSVLLAKVGEEKARIAIAATSERMKELSDLGFGAVIGGGLVDATNKPINPFGELIRANAMDITFDGVKTGKNTGINNILSQFGYIAMAPQPSKEQVAQPVTLTPVQVLGDAEVVAKNAEKLEKIAQQITQPTLIKTTFADKFVKYDAEKISTMNVSDINKKILKSNLWVGQPLEAHLTAGHQNLDAMILGLAIRDALPAHPSIGSSGSLQTAATGYSVTIDAIQDVVASSKTTAEILTNFNKAYRKIVAFDPELLKSENTSFDLVLGLKRAAYDYENKGLPLNEALQTHLKDNAKLLNAYSSIVESLSTHEKLFTGEKSFVRYLNGFVLNAPDGEIGQLSDALLSRMQPTRIETGFSFDGYESSNSILHPSTIAAINAKSAVDFNENQSTEDLKSKWGVTFVSSQSDQHLSQGFIGLIDGMLTKLQKGTGMDNHSIGQNATISFSHRGRDTTPNANISLALLDGNKERIYDRFVSQWVDLLSANAEKLERASMAKDTMAHLDDLNVHGRGLVHMIVYDEYKPTSDAGKKIAELHDYFVGGGDNSQVSPAEMLLSKSKNAVDVSASNLNQHSNHSNDDPDVLYADYFKKLMIKKQIEAVSVVDQKIKAIFTKDADATDMYALNSLSKTFSKVMDIKVTATTSTLKAFHESVGDKNHVAENTKIISDAVLNGGGVIADTEAFLASHAKHLILKSIVSHAPAHLIQDSDFEKNINRDLPRLVDHIDGVSINAYQHPIAHELANNLIHSQTMYKDDGAWDYSNNLNVDAVLSLTLRNSIKGGSVTIEPKQADLIAAIASTVVNDVSVEPQKPLKPKKVSNNSNELSAE